MNLQIRIRKQTDREEGEGVSRAVEHLYDKMVSLRGQGPPGPQLDMISSDT